MSFPLFDVPRNFLRRKAVTIRHDDTYSIELSLKEAAKEDCKLEPSSFLAGILHPCVHISNGCDACFQPENADKDEKSPIEIRRSCDIDVLGTSIDFKEQAQDKLLPALETNKAGLEDADFENGGSESPVEELVSNFASGIHFSSDCSMKAVDKLQGHIQHEGDKIKELKTSSHIIDYLLRELGTSVPSSLAAVLPFPEVNGVSSDSLFEDSGKPVYLSGNCTVGSTKLKSALRGGYEELGLGARPKFRVSWAPDVLEPVCTSASHTVSQNYRRHRSKKNDHKHQNTGKASHADSWKKCDKNPSRKSRHVSETFTVRSQVSASQKKKHSSNLRKVGYGRLSSLMLSQKISPLSGILQLDESRFAKLDTRIPLSWQTQTQ